VSQTVASRAVFTARPGGVKMRLYLPSSQAVAGYTAGTSNSITG